MTKQKGIFIISLDFELYWGERDRENLEDYKEILSGGRSAIPPLLKLFEEYEIHATWATVGFLFFESRDELIRALPARKPDYANSGLSPYSHINNIGNNEKEDPFHYAPSLIRLIHSFPYQEIGIHTFSHYYCLERGQDVHSFRDDLGAGIKAAKKYNITIENLVFPRNQFNSEYISVCREMGIKAYRGNMPHWIYKARTQEEESLLIRGLRLLDSYFNVSGRNCYSVNVTGHALPLNIPASRYLRPYSDKLKILEPFRLRRILSDLDYAAKKGLIYHLWWHPHNFGINFKENMLFLKKILNHYTRLREDYGMSSLNIGELARRLIRGAGHAE